MRVSTDKNEENENIKLKVDPEIRPVYPSFYEQNEENENIQKKVYPQNTTTHGLLKNTAPYSAFHLVKVEGHCHYKGVNR